MAVVISLFAAFGIVISIMFWDSLRSEQESPSEAIRNLGIFFGGIIALVLAVWKNMIGQQEADISQKQVEIAQEKADIERQNRLEDQFQKSAEMLTHSDEIVRINGIRSLVDMARDNPQEYMPKVSALISNVIQGSSGKRNIRILP